MDDSKNKKLESDANSWPFYRLLIVYGGIIISLTYLKILWPLVYGRIHNDGYSFIEAVKDQTVHVLALVILISIILIAYFWEKVSPFNKNAK